MRALTKLSRVGAVDRHADGTAPEMPLEKIVGDSNNPRPPLHLRTHEEQQKQAELNANVLKRGVKSPISLRPHPTLADTWVINHGHCRYDAARTAGFTTIPYFIDPNFDSYDQVNENLHRCDLSIWAIAAFIKRKLDEGHSKSQIAEGLGKEGQNYVTEHLALVDAPNCVHQAFANSVKSPRTLYDLRRAYDEFPEQVEEWCNGGNKVTRDSIRELLEGLRHDVAGTARSVAVVTDLGPQQTPSLMEDLSDVESIGGDTQLEMQKEGAYELLRPDEVPAPRTSDRDRDRAFTLRHDVKRRPASAQQSADTHANAPTETSAILVSYRGQRARIALDTRVRIVIEGDVASLDVPLADLVFESMR